MQLSLLKVFSLCKDQGFVLAEDGVGVGWSRVGSTTWGSWKAIRRQEGTGLPFKSPFP